MDGKKFLYTVKKISGTVTRFVNHTPPIPTPVVTIYYRQKNMKQYLFTIINDDTFEIGSEKENDLVLNSKMVEKQHAIIYENITKSRVYYQLINYGKVNPIHYFNKQTEQYECLKYKEAIELDDHDIFYIGDVKVLIRIQ